jgi:hypothetical protein
MNLAILKFIWEMGVWLIAAPLFFGRQGLGGMPCYSGLHDKRRELLEVPKLESD